MLITTNLTDTLTASSNDHLTIYKESNQSVGIFLKKANVFMHSDSIKASTLQELEALHTKPTYRASTSRMRLYQTAAPHLSMTNSPQALRQYDNYNNR